MNGDKFDILKKKLPLNERHVLEIVKRYNGSSNARKIIFFTLLSSLLKKSLKKGILTKVKSDGDAI